MGKPDGKRPLERPRRKRGGNISVVQEIGLRVDSADPAHCRGKMAGCFKDGIEPSDSIKFGEFLDLLWSHWLLKKVAAPQS